MKDEVNTSSSGAKAAAAVCTAMALPFLGPFAFLAGLLVHAAETHEAKKRMQGLCGDTEEALKNAWLQNRQPDEMQLCITTVQEYEKRMRVFTIENNDLPSLPPPWFPHIEPPATLSLPELDFDFDEYQRRRLLPDGDTF